MTLSTSPTFDVPRGPGLDPAWSRWVSVTDGSGEKHTWHVLDTRADEPDLELAAAPDVRRKPAPELTLLCVHGNPTWSYLWRRLLAAAPARWRVIAPDHLGMGYSERLAVPRTLGQRVDDLGDLTAALGVTGPVITVGHDWGGAISLGWALAHGDQLRGVVLANTAIAQPPGDLGPALIRLANAGPLIDAVCKTTPVFVRATTALSRPPLPRDVRRAFAAPYRTPERRQSVRDFVDDIPFSRDHPSRHRLEAIADGVRGLDVPALLLWGPRDPVFLEKYLADLRQRLPQASLHRFEGASHLLPEDAPQYADAVVRWVEDVSRDDWAGAGSGAEVAGAEVAGAAAAPHRPQRQLWSALDDRAQDLSPAVVEVGGPSVSWKALATRVREVAAGLSAAGVRPGSRVALLVPPSAELTAAVYAVWRAGAVVVVADKGLGLAGMRRALRSADVDHVIAAGPGLVAATAMRLPGTRIAAGPVSLTRHLPRVRATLDELARQGREAGAQPPAEPSVTAECAVVFTSGATGPAKGVVYRHAQVLAQMELLRAAYSLTGEDRMVAAFAPFALLGPALGIGSAAPAIDVTAPGSLTAHDLADAVRDIDATVVFAAPAALRRVAATSEALTSDERSSLAEVRLLMSAGAPVPAALLRSLQAVLPRAEMHTPYGMTEALPVTDISLDEIVAAGSGNGVCVGRPLPGVEVALRALSAAGVADGQLSIVPAVTGEICVRAAHVKDRYDALWLTERMTRLESGWHRTGDVGHLDVDGRLWVEGRLLHVVTTAAGPVTPVGVEQRIEQVPGIASAALVGVGPAGTQAAVVVVVLDEAVQAQPSERRRPTAWRRAATSSRRPVTAASSELTARMRDAAAPLVDVAAVLTARRMPLDIRHASKIDRRKVARWAADALAGERSDPGAAAAPS